MHKAMTQRTTETLELKGSYADTFWQILICPNAAGLVIVAKDITESKKALNELIEAKEDWERTFDSVPDPIIVLDKNYRITRINRAMKQKIGVKADETVEQPCYKYVHGKDGPPNFCPHSKTIRDGREHTEEFYEPKLGEYFKVTTTPIKDAEGNVLGSVHVARDITQQKAIQEELENNEIKYRLLADNSRDVIWTMNLEGKFTYVSPSVQQLRGYAPEEVLKQSISEALTPQSAQIILDGFQHYFQTGEIPSKNFELEQPCKDGSTVWTEVNFTVLRDPNGQAEGILGISRDISQRKKAEEKIECINEKLRVVGSLTRHDVANKLMGAKGHIYLLKKEVKDNPKALTYVEGIEQSINQSANIFEFSRLYERVGVEALTYRCRSLL